MLEAGAPGWEAWVVVATLVACVLAMARDAAEPPVVLLVALGGLTAAGVVTPDRAFAGLASPALVTVGAFLALGGAVERSPALPWIARHAMSAGLLPVALMSSVVPNTPAVAVMIPAVRLWARERGVPPSRLLMPMSFAAVLGGACTLVGTSSNLVVHGLLLAAGAPGLSMFELAWAGAPVAAAGLLYGRLAAPRLLPDRADPLHDLDRDPREYLARLKVSPGGRHDGATVEALRHLEGLFVVGVERQGHLVSPVSPRHALVGGDVLLFAGQIDGIAKLAASAAGALTAPEHDGGRSLSGAQLVEAVVSPTSPLIGQNIRSAGFRALYDAAVVAVHRHGERLAGRIGDIVVHAGDTLLLAAGEDFLPRWRHSPDFYVATAAGRVEAQPAARDWLPVALLLCVVALATAGLLGLIPAAVGAVVVLILTGHLPAADLWRALRVPTLLLIAAAIGLGHAFVDTGAGELVARLVEAMADGGGPERALVAILLGTAILSEAIHRAAVAALMFPIAAGLASAASIPLHAAGVAVALGCAWTFVTPGACQAHAMVAGAGGYRGSDFVRFGLPLKLLALALGAPLLVWSTGVGG